MCFFDRCSFDLFLVFLQKKDQFLTRSSRSDSNMFLALIDAFGVC